MITPGALLALALVGNVTLGPVVADRARANYEALMNGSKQVSQLTPQELAAVLAFAEALRDDRGDQSPSERCFAEQLERSGDSPSALEQRVIDLKCRPLGAGLN